MNISQTFQKHFANHGALYAKNLFTVRTKKADYVISKTLVCSVGGSLMILTFFVGLLLGGILFSVG